MALKQLYSDLTVPLIPGGNSLFADLASGEKYTKQLKFGSDYKFVSDQPSNGFSLEPFVKTYPPEFSKTDFSNTSLRSSEVLQFVNNASDTLVRGGIITATQRRAIDAERIGKFLVSPRGFKFILGQQQLQLTNWGGQFDTPPKEIYNPLSTLAQVTEMPQGLTGNRGFKRTGLFERAGGGLTQDINYYTKIRENTRIAGNRTETKLSLGYDVRLFTREIEGSFNYRVITMGESGWGGNSITDNKNKLGVDHPYFQSNLLSFKDNNKSFLGASLTAGSSSLSIPFMLPTSTISNFLLKNVFESGSKGKDLINTSFKGFNYDPNPSSSAHPYFHINSSSSFNSNLTGSSGINSSKLNRSYKKPKEPFEDNGGNQLLNQSFDGFNYDPNQSLDHPYFHINSPSSFNLNLTGSSGVTSSKFNPKYTPKNPFEDNDGKQLLNRSFDGFSNFNSDHSNKNYDYNGNTSLLSKKLQTNSSSSLKLNDRDGTQFLFNDGKNSSQIFETDKGKDLDDKTFNGFKPDTTSNLPDPIHNRSNNLPPTTEFLNTSNIYRRIYETNENVTREKRIGDPDYSSNYILTANTLTRIDKLNFRDISNDSSFERNKDLIKFRFSDISNDIETNENYLYFRATLTSISDNYKPEWNSYNYVGRGEKFYIYKGFDRSFSFNFTVFAMSAKEMRPIWRKLNYLASNTTPDYSDNGRIRGPLMKLTIGDYLYNQPGFIENLTFTINDNYPWDIGIIEGENSSDFSSRSSKLEMPMGVDVQVNYKIIPDYLPQKGLPGNGNRFIYLKNNQGEDWWKQPEDIQVPEIAPLDSRLRQDSGIGFIPIPLLPPSINPTVPFSFPPIPEEDILIT